MKRRLAGAALWGVLLLVSRMGIAQSGNYFLTHFAPTNEKIDYLNFDIAQSKSGIIYFANKAGIVEFDGRNWDVIETPGSTYTLSTHDDQLYVGGLSGFGKVVLDEQNNQSYKLLSTPFPEAGNIFGSESTDQGVYFINEDAIFYCPYGEEEPIIKTQAPAEHHFTGMYRIQNKVYATIESGLILKAERDKVVPGGLDFLNNDDLLFANEQDKNPNTLLGTSSDRLYLYDGKSASEIHPADSAYLDNNVIIGGTWVNDHLIAIGTLRGGVVFINPQTGGTEEIINYYTGLPDNEVFALLCDRNEGVWVAHDYGFTRIAPYLPFRTFNHYPGIRGNLLGASSVGNQVYVATSVGLYHLAKEEVYGEEIYYVTRFQKGGTVSEKAEQKEANDEREKGRKGLFSFLKRKKSKEDKEPEPKEQPTKPSSSPKKIVEKRSRRVLKSLDYAYHKVEGIRGKVTQLAVVDGKLLVAGIGGMYEVTEEEASPILSEPVRTFYYSPSIRKLLISTYEERIKTFEKNTDEWKASHELDTLHEYVGNIFEDRIQNIWLCGRASVTKVEMANGQIASISQIPFSTPVLDETTGFALGNDVYVAASGAFHQYDVVKNQFVKYDSLPGPRKYFTASQTFWFNDGHHWQTVNTKLHQALKLEWLALFKDIRYLSLTDNGNGLWLITASNELYRFGVNGNVIEGTSYPLLLKEVRGPDRKLRPQGRLNVDEQQSALIFEFIQPEYLSSQTVEYQYFVQGVTHDWSNWSPENNIVNFPYLPSGEYVLQVKSRDLFGGVNALNPITFYVEPPYWQQTWFYALEFIFFGSLVLLTIRLSGANSKYNYVSRLLSVLTVIMLIQFIQTAAESFIEVGSPVMDFFVQVIIALMVLPLEGFLRKAMTLASEGRYNLGKKSKGISPTTES